MSVEGASAALRTPATAEVPFVCSRNASSLWHARERRLGSPHGGRAATDGGDAPSLMASDRPSSSPPLEVVAAGVPASSGVAPSSPEGGLLARRGGDGGPIAAASRRPSSAGYRGGEAQRGSRPFLAAAGAHRPLPQRSGRDSSNPKEGTARAETGGGAPATSRSQQMADPVASVGSSGGGGGGVARRIGGGHPRGAACRLFVAVPQEAGAHDRPSTATRRLLRAQQLAAEAAKAMTLGLTLASPAASATDKPARPMVAESSRNGAPPPPPTFVSPLQTNRCTTPIAARPLTADEHKLRRTPPESLTSGAFEAEVGSNSFFVAEPSKKRFNGLEGESSSTPRLRHNESQRGSAAASGITATLEATPAVAGQADPVAQTLPQKPVGTGSGDGATAVEPLAPCTTCTDPTRSQGVWEATAVRSSFLSTPFTLLDPEYYTDTTADVGVPLSAADCGRSALNKGRAMFLQWYPAAMADMRGFDYPLVWIDGALHTIRHATSSLLGRSGGGGANGGGESGGGTSATGNATAATTKEPPTVVVYRTLACAALLVHALQVAVPAPAQPLVFGLLDEMLSGFFEDWKGTAAGLQADDDAFRASVRNAPQQRSRDTAPAPAAATAAARLKASLVTHAQQIQQCRATQDGGRGFNASTAAGEGDQQEEPLLLLAARRGTVDRLLGARRMFCEATAAAALETRRTLADCQRRLADAAEANQRRCGASLAHARSYGDALAGVVLRAWHGFVVKQRAKKRTATGVVEAMDRRVGRCLLRIGWLALRENCLVEGQRKGRHDTTDATRRWREREAALLLDGAKLRQQIVELKVEHRSIVAAMEEAHFGEIGRINVDTMDLHNRAAKHEGIVAGLRSDLARLRDEHVRWAQLSSALFFEATGAVPLPPFPAVTAPMRRHPEDELLYVDLAAPPATAAPTAAADAASALAATAGRRASSLPSPSPPPASQRRRRVQVTPYASLPELLRAPMATDRLLLRWANVLLARHRPRHAPLANFGMDWSDGEGYVALLATLFPQRVANPGALCDAAAGASAAQRADVVVACLAQEGLGGMITALDIVLGVALRNFALVAELFKRYAAVTREDPSEAAADVALCPPAQPTDDESGPAVSSPRGTQRSPSPPSSADDRSAALLQLAAPPRVQRNESCRPLASLLALTKAPVVDDLSVLETHALATVFSNRAWHYLADFVGRDAARRLQNVRSQRGEILDERHRRHQEWFCSIDEWRCEALLATTEIPAVDDVGKGIASFATQLPTGFNEVDKIRGVLDGLYWTLRSVYQGAAAQAFAAASVNAGQSLLEPTLMTQHALFALVKECNLLKGMPPNTLELAYDAALRPPPTPSAPSDEGPKPPPRIVFAPTATVSQKKLLPASVANQPVTPKTFIHVLVFIAHRRLALASVSNTKVGSAAAGAPQCLSEALRRLVADDIAASPAGGSIACQAEAFREDARQPLVLQLYRKPHKQLARVFCGYGVSASGATAGGSKESKTVDATAFCLPLAGTLKLFKELRLLDGHVTPEVVAFICGALCQDDHRLQAACERQSETERLNESAAVAPTAPSGLAFGDFLDALSAVAAMRAANPLESLRAKVEALVKETLVPRLKEVVF